jgi:hypothetical protein
LLGFDSWLLRNWLALRGGAHGIIDATTWFFRGNAMSSQFERTLSDPDETAGMLAAARRLPSWKCSASPTSPPREALFHLGKLVRDVESIVKNERARPPILDT